MDERNNPYSKTQSEQFADAAEGSQDGILKEFWGFLMESKKWWLTPIVLVLLLVTALILLGGTGAAPFIYTLF